MAVFRIEKTRDYTVMSNHHLQDKSLSLKAKGLLSLMLSLPEEWDYTTKGLARICKDGVDSICAGVRELEEHGYVIRQRVRNPNGQLGAIEYTILEQPRPPEPEKPKRENPVLDNPEQAYPVLEEPEQGNPAQLNTNKSSKEKSKKDLSSTEGSNPVLSSPKAPRGSDGMGRDWMRERESYRELILENIEYVSLLVNDGKVSDHHAIIPTLKLEKADLSALPVGERNLLLLVCREVLCAAAEPYVYEAVTATFECGGHTFTAKGRHVLSLGWKDIDRIFRASLKENPEDEAESAALPDFTKGQTFDQMEAAVTEHFTAPSKAYTEDTLLSAMENAGKEDIPEDAERRGLGTPATRAAILEKLVAAGFVERKGKSLIPTKARINLVTVLPDTLTSPILTAEWEQKLTAIARGEADPAEFMAGITGMAWELVQKYSHISEEGQKLFAPERETVGLCPRCGKPVYEGKKNFYCSDRSCQFVMWKDDRFWTPRKKELTKKMAGDLLKKGRTSVKGMWSEKKGSTYDAVVVLDDTGGKYVRFKLEFPKRKEGVNGR